MNRKLAIASTTLALLVVSNAISNHSQSQRRGTGRGTVENSAADSDRLPARSWQNASLSSAPIPTVTGPRVSDRFPNIDLIDHRGRNIKFYDDLVRDRCVCIVFFYTRCTGSCPGTTATLKRVRSALKHEFENEEFAFVSLTLEPDVDTPEELRDYMDSYGIEDDIALPDWIYATGDFEELDGLRRSLGVYDLDPIIDADKAEHAAIITFGNDRTNRWAALPTGLKTEYLTDTIIRIVGESQRQCYGSSIQRQGESHSRATAEETCKCSKSSCCASKALAGEDCLVPKSNKLEQD